MGWGGVGLGNVTLSFSPAFLLGKNMVHSSSLRVAFLASKQEEAKGVKAFVCSPRGSFL